MGKAMFSILLVKLSPSKLHFFGFWATWKVIPFTNLLAHSSTHIIYIYMRIGMHPMYILCMYIYILYLIARDINQVRSVGDQLDRLANDSVPSTKKWWCPRGGTFVGL